MNLHESLTHRGSSGSNSSELSLELEFGEGGLRVLARALRDATSRPALLPESVVWPERVTTIPLVRVGKEIWVPDALGCVIWKLQRKARLHA